MDAVVNSRLNVKSLQHCFIDLQVALNDPKLAQFILFTRSINTDDTSVVMSNFRNSEGNTRDFKSQDQTKG